MPLSQDSSFLVLLDFVEEGWRFDRETYHKLPCDDEWSENYRPRDLRAFKVAHVIKHMVKTTGKIQAEVEPFDHRDGPVEVSPRFIAQQIINTLRLARLVGIPPEQILHEIEEWAAEHQVERTPNCPHGFHRKGLCHLCNPGGELG